MFKVLTATLAVAFMPPARPAQEFMLPQPALPSTSSKLGFPQQPQQVSLGME